MNSLLKRLPLRTKLLLLAAVPGIFIAVLSVRLYEEKALNVSVIGRYLDRIHQSASLTRLIDELQKERSLSFDYALEKKGKEEMLAQRVKTDSAIWKLQQDNDEAVKEFTRYTFLEKIDTTRALIDNGSLSAANVIHFYSGSIFRVNTLNNLPTNVFRPLQDIYSDMAFQRLLSDMITYQGIINANVYTMLYTRQYVVETIIGTYGTYDVYKTYQKELEIKANEYTRPLLSQLQQGALKQVDSYLEGIFTRFNLDSTYTYQEWSRISDQSLNELRTVQMNLLASVEQRLVHYYEKEKWRQYRTIIYLVLVTTVLAFVVVYILTTITHALKELKDAATQMADGKTDIDLVPVSNDAVGSLATSIKKVDEKNKELAQAAYRIGEGDFSVDIRARSEDDKLGNAIRKMKENLQRMTSDLRNSREEFRTLADMMPQIVWTARPDGHIDYYNRKWYEITGAKEGFGDQSWIPVLHPDDVGPALTAWYRSVETGTSFEVEYRFRHADSNTFRWFLARALPVKDEKGNVIKWFGTATDIHDQKMRKEELEELVAQRTLDLKRSNDDLQQFAHVASHDLKEPVRKMRTFSQRLASEFGDLLPEKGKIYVDKLQNSSERMANMIDSILSYSIVNATEQETEPVDLSLLIDGILNDLELLVVQKEAKINYRDLPKIKGIPTLIYQLFYNLISNSLKFAKPDTPPEISITSRMLSAEEASDLDLSRANQYCEITIRDNGIGFPQEYADKVFNVFTRLNPRDRYEGTGLGLALCRKIVHRHGGVISAKSEEGAGAEFRVVLQC